ncbi:transcriptional regulator [Herbaspirillum sp. CF444]|uniref:LysR family transcriptional regulator n=1 Tax=Herbaspirillum sp. CF444 TaxID=1144319 RepID=UPI0002723A65|nr:LysR family transcriptional regulator [Herbaspirillum sp. CF444]EJL85080.1 transcriptional regulator [Herbaspirillum sp. CF444]
MDKARVVTIFLGVVRAGSFSRAAVEAGMTPQAVSKAVGQLEEHLGVRLFHRTTRKLSLTEEGARLSELADPGLRLLDEALDQVQNSRRDAEGVIRVSAPTSVGNLLLMPLIQKFQEQYPNIHFDFLLDDRFTDLVAERVDVGFRTGKEPQRNLVARRLGDIVLQIYAAPSYLEKYGKPKNLAELRKHRCTGFRHPNNGRLSPWMLTVDGTTVFQEMPAVVSFNTMESEVAAVQAGVGIGQLVVYSTREQVAAGKLVPILPRLNSVYGGMYMYYPQRTQMPLRVRHFIDFIIEELRKAPI